MPGPYYNFDDAWYYLKQNFTWAKQSYGYAITSADAAYVGASDPVDKLHFGYLCYAVSQLGEVFRYIAELNAGTYSYSHLYMSIFWASQGGAAYELTAEKICEAWAKDNFAGRTITIAFIDRQRQLIWNEPFFAAWAAKPENGD